MDQLPRLGKRELICLLLVTCNYVVSVWRGFLFLWMLGMGYVILLWHSLSLPYNYFVYLSQRTVAYFMQIIRPATDVVYELVSMTYPWHTCFVSMAYAWRTFCLAVANHSYV